MKKMRLSLNEIAERVGGEIDGDGGVQISGAAPFEAAGKGDIAFAENAKLLKKIAETDAGAVIVPQGFDNAQKTLLRTENPKVAFAKVLEIFYPRKRQPEGTHPSALIGQGYTCGRNVSIGPGVMIQDHVTLGDRVTLHPHVFIGDHVVIGDDTEIFPNVTVFERCRIGSRVIIHAGTVIGSDGFGYAPDGETYYKIPHVGFVQIDDDVEIGACNTIDRATFGKTWIQQGVKTDNLVMIAHNVTIGENTILIAQSGVAGSTTIGKHVILAAQAGVSQHLTVDDGAIIAPQTGVVKPVAKNAVVSGSPERRHQHHIRIQHIISRLPELKKRIDTLEKRMDEMEKSR